MDLKTQIAAGGLACALLLAGCSLGERKQRAALLEASAGRLSELGVASGTYAVATRIVEVPNAATGLPIGAVMTEQQAGQGGAFPEVRVAVAFDAATWRATASLRQGTFTAVGADVVDLTPREGQRGSEAFAFEGLTAYSRRFGRGSGVSTRDWTRLDLEKIDEPPEPTLEGVAGNLGPPMLAALNPALVAWLVIAVLDGSVERVGADEVNGVPASRYRANISLEQFLLELDPPERQRRAYERLFAALSFDVMSVSPAQLWLDADGVLRKISVTFTQRPARRVELAATYTLEIADIDDDAEVTVPADNDTVEVETIGQLVEGFRVQGGP